MAERKRMTKRERDEDRDHRDELEKEERRRENREMFTANRAHRFMKGHPKFGGRQKGTPNRITTILRDGLESAAAQVGFVEKGKGGRTITGVGGVEGWLMSLAAYEPHLFVKLMMLSAQAEFNGKFNVTVSTNMSFKNVDELKARFRERGIPLPPSLKLLPPPTKAAIANG